MHAVLNEETLETEKAAMPVILMQYVLAYPSESIDLSVCLFPCSLTLLKTCRARDLYTIVWPDFSRLP